MTDDRHLGFARHGVGTVRPYIFGHVDLATFIQQTFNATELERIPVGSGFHVEAQIGDSVIMMELGGNALRVGTASAIYVFVPDVDAAYERAIQAGATSIVRPEDKPYQERAAGVKDSFGNTWWIATYRA